MSTPIILTKEVEALGAEGDTVHVADGYARNYLIPRGFAIPATTANLRRVESLRKKRAEALAARKAEAEALAKKIGKVSVSVAAPVGADGKLFGSVTAADIAENLASQGIEVERKKIVIEHPLREVGVFEVGIKLHPEVHATVKVNVVASAAAASVAEDSTEKPRSGSRATSSKRESAEK